jgi:uncharacterized protein DUF6677
MSNPSSPPSVVLPAPTYSPLAGLLSYLVPGLGQIYQGRFAKGLLFMVCLYGMFFYGMSLGQWQNVYLPPFKGQPQQQRIAVVRRSPIDTILDFIRPLGQVWVGVVVWPAIIQAYTYENPQDKHPYLGTFMRMPSEEVQKEVLRDSDKTPDVGWMYTVIAGVLNILVIYDAFAGPAFAAAPLQPSRQPGPQQEAALP